MKQSLFKTNIILNPMDSIIISLPAPANLSLWWNMGSLLSISLITQIISGLLLASVYTPSLTDSFFLVILNMETTDKGWMLRYLHSNMASMFFILIYLHMGRGLYFSSFSYTHTWNIGVLILLASMATAFMGYVLPTNQMSFWGASVITNLFSEVPYIGKTIVTFIWGGSSVASPTIMRFFTFHFILPFMIMLLVLIHIMFLHQTGSNNPLGLNSNQDKILFNPYFIYKDLMGLSIFTLFFSITFLTFPLTLGDNDNFAPANPSLTPHHIQPEWYFLFAYAILRSIPNKLGGILALLFSILILFYLPLSFKPKMKSMAFCPPLKILFWLFISSSILLSWTGAMPVEQPYLVLSQSLTFTYFMFFVTLPIIASNWTSIH